MSDIEMGRICEPEAISDLDDTVAAVFDGIPFSLRDALSALHEQRRLRDILREFVIDRWLEQEAVRHGLNVSIEELQQSANDYRRRRGLHSGEQARRWLAEQQLSLDQFEAGLRRRLLIEKLKDHVTRELVAEHLRSHGAQYGRVRLRQIVVPREDLALELLCQLWEERADFETLARRYSQHPSHIDSGLLGEVSRRQLPIEVATAIVGVAPGEVVGPLALKQGFTLFKVEATWPPTLDDETTADVRAELFEAWLQEQLRQRPLSFPLLDAL